MSTKKKLYKKLKNSSKGSFSKTEIFKSKARQVHGNKYDYSKSIYKGARVKVHIICPIHGDFYQTPFEHVNCQAGCHYCGYNRFNKDLFLEFVNKIHIHKYTYHDADLIMYRRTLDIIKIECPTHGIFYQRLDVHLNGNGCPACSGRPYNYKNQVIYDTQELSTFIN